MKKRGIFIFLFAGLISSCHPSQKYQLSILHINDMHAQFVPRESVGGFISLNNVIQKNRNTNTLLLDAGDVQTGTLLSNLEFKSALGGGVIELMNLMKFDASVLGNHDFDQGWQNTRRLMEIANFPILSANVFLNDTLFGDAPYAIFKRDKLAVGVIGLTTEHLTTLVAKKQIRGIHVEPIENATQQLADQLDPSTDVIVLLTHEGFREDSLLALKLKNVDIIVGGHSHTVLKSPVIVNDILIVQAGSSTHYLGKMDLNISHDRISNYHYQLLPVESAQPESNSRLSALVDSFQTSIDASYNRTIGQLRSPWTTELYGESNIGNAIADMLREVTDADFAVINSGAIRKLLAAGPVTMRDIYEIFPFNNEIIAFQISGVQLQQLCRTNAYAGIRRQEGILQVSGLSYQFKKTGPDSVTITDFRINGNPVEPDSIYRGASVDYVVIDNSDRYFGFSVNSYEKTGYYLPETMIVFIREKSPIHSVPDHRIVEIQ